MGVKMRGILLRGSFIYILLLLWPLCNGFFDTVRCSESIKTYVGSEACKECYELEYTNFKKHAKKNDSFGSIMTMKRGLTEEEFKECLKFHITG